MVPNTQLQNVNLLMWQRKDTVRYHAKHCQQEQYQRHASSSNKIALCEPGQGNHCGMQGKKSNVVTLSVSLLK